MIRMEVSAQVGSVKRIADLARSQADSQSAIRALCDAVDRLSDVAESMAVEMTELRRMVAEKDR